MNAERRASVASTDHERLEQFLTVLPETEVRNYLETLMAGGYCHSDFIDMLNAYDEGISKSKLFAFNHPELHVRYREFDLACDAMRLFLAEHFFHVPPHIFSLYPEMKNSPNAELRARWRERFEAFGELAEIFKDKYNQFLTMARKALAQEASSPRQAAPAPVERPNVIQKGAQSIHLPELPSKNWATASMRFVDDRNVLLSNGQKREQYSFDGLGFADERTKPAIPDGSWGFLRDLALGNGRITISSKEDREAEKKKKQKAKSILCKIFEIEEDPFDTDGYGVYVAKFNIEYPTSPDAKAPIRDTKLSDLESFREEMTAPRERERPEKEDGDFSQ